MPLFDDDFVFFGGDICPLLVNFARYDFLELFNRVMDLAIVLDITIKKRLLTTLWRFSQLFLELLFSHGDGQRAHRHGTHDDAIFVEPGVLSYLVDRRSLVRIDLENLV